MSNLSNQQQNQSYPGLLQIDNGITSTLKPVQDGDGNFSGLWLSSQKAQIGGVASDSILQIPGGITTSLQTVLDGDGNPTGLQLSSSGASVTTSSTFVPSVNGTQIPNSVPRLVSDGFGDYISVKDFGAVGDGVTNDQVAIQNAVNYAASTGKALYIPAGVYYMPNTGPSIQVSGGSNLSMFGDGMDVSVLYWNDSAQTSYRNDFFNIGTGSLPKAGNIDFCDIGFKSSWGNGGVYSSTNGSQMVNIYGAGDWTGVVNITRCKFSNSRYMLLIMSELEEVRVTNCSFVQSVADGCRATGCNNVTVEGNYFKSVNDDSIAIHTIDTDASPTKCVRVIANNKIVDSQGIAILGGHHVAVTGNALTRTQSRCIYVGNSSFGVQEGATPVVSVTITGNTITDYFDGTTFYSGSGDNGGYIRIDGYNLDNVGSGYVNGSNGTSVNQPYPYLYTNGETAATQNPGNWWVNVSGNTCVRTLAPTSAYSNYGFGVRIGRNGPVDPAITQTKLDTIGFIQINGALSDAIIANNVISGSYSYGIIFTATASLPVASYRNVKIVANTFTNISSLVSGVTRAIQIPYGNGEIHIQGNTFDLDPFCVSYYRGANGTWASGSGDLMAAITLGESKGIIENNIFKNMGSTHGGGLPETWIWHKNTLICNPTALGYNAANVGIGDIGTPQAYDASFIIEDGDPTSSTYGTVLNTCQTYSNPRPSSGKYVQGLFVAYSLAGIQGGAGSQYILQGWFRATTGSSHVLNTDWYEVRTPTGT